MIGPAKYKLVLYGEGNEPIEVATIHEGMSLEVRFPRHPKVSRATLEYIEPDDDDDTPT